MDLSNCLFKGHSFAMYLAVQGYLHTSALANSIHISESHIIMHILLYPYPSICKLCLYETPRRRPQPICLCVTEAIDHPQCGGHNNCAGVDGHNCNFGRDISTLSVLLSAIDGSHGNLPGSFFCLKCLWADDVGYAECCGNKGATRYLFLLSFCHCEMDSIDLNTFMVYPLKFAPVHAKISANGATVYLLLAAT